MEQPRFGTPCTSCIELPKIWPGLVRRQAAPKTRQESQLTSPFRPRKRAQALCGTLAALFHTKMQKILKRVATAERVAAKRKATRDKQAWQKSRFEERDEVRYQRAQMAEDFGRAKRAIKDDWFLGPSAPNINVGEHGPTHGAISEARYQMSGSLKEHQKEARCAWLGGAKNLNLAEGDRVVLLEGPDKGKIGKVTTVYKDKMEVIVEGLNKVSNTYSAFILTCSLETNEL
jgi:hypothetical protein